MLTLLQNPDKTLVQPLHEKKMEKCIWIYTLSKPLLWFIAWQVAEKRKCAAVKVDSVYSKLYDGISPSIMRVRKGAARWPALDEIYNWKPTKTGLVGMAENFWFNIRNAQAVRNRYKIVVSLLREAACSIIAREGEVRVMSIASGSAQCIFDALQGLPNVKILCVDSDITAIEHSRELAKRYSISDVTWHTQDVRNPAIVEETTHFKPHIVEMVGLIDYFSDKAITHLCKRILGILDEKGFFITGHIHENDEVHFLEVVSDWNMRYRSAEHLELLVRSSGFSHCQLFTEPHKIHTVCLASR